MRTYITYFARYVVKIARVQG